MQLTISAVPIVASSKARLKATSPVPIRISASENNLRGERRTDGQVTGVKQRSVNINQQVVGVSVVHIQVGDDGRNGIQPLQTGDGGLHIEGDFSQGDHSCCGRSVGVSQTGQFHCLFLVQSSRCQKVLEFRVFIIGHSERDVVEGQMDDPILDICRNLSMRNSENSKFVAIDANTDGLVHSRDIDRKCERQLEGSGSTGGAGGGTPLGWLSEHQGQLTESNRLDQLQNTLIGKHGGDDEGFDALVEPSYLKDVSYRVSNIHEFYSHCHCQR